MFEGLLGLCDGRCSILQTAILNQRRRVLVVAFGSNTAHHLEFCLSIRVLPIKGCNFSIGLFVSNCVLRALNWPIIGLFGVYLQRSLIVLVIITGTLCDIVSKAKESGVIIVVVGGACYINIAAHLYF